MKKYIIILLLSLSSFNYLFSRADSLIAYWSFEDSTARDFSGNDYHGVFVNNPLPVIGIKNGTGMRFNGKGYYIIVGDDIKKIGDHILLPRIDFVKIGAFTISLWVFEESMSHYHGDAYILFGNWNTGWLGISHAAPLPDTTNYINFTVGSREVSNCLRVPFDFNSRKKWMLYTLVYDGNKVDAYINANYMGSIVQPILISDSTQALGRHWWYYSNEYRTSARFTGVIDEVKIFSKALTIKEIKGEYESAFLKISYDSTKLCQGDTLILTASEGFLSYLWSTGETTRSIKVTKNGKYKVTAKSKEGFELETTCEVTNFILTNLEIKGLENEQSLKFGEIIKNDIKCKKILIFNHEQQAVVLNKISLKSNTTFSIPQSQLPFVIPANSSRYLEVCCSPIYNKFTMIDTLSILAFCFFKEIYLECVYQPDRYYGLSQCNVNIEANTKIDKYLSRITISDLFPNPCDKIVNFSIYNNKAENQLKIDDIKIINSYGVESRLFPDKIDLIQNGDQIDVNIFLDSLDSGFYLLILKLNDGSFSHKYFILAR